MDISREMEADDAGERIWPLRSIHPNPEFERDGSIGQLVCGSTLDADRAGAFWSESWGLPEGEPLRLCRRQAKAVGVAKCGESFVRTTGTGPRAQEASGLPHPHR